jgi:nucleoside-diphosphate-sugar epimerase
MQVFLTGGSGFIGGALLRRLTGEGQEVAVLTRSDRAGRAVQDAGGLPVRGDIVLPGEWQTAAAAADIVVHAAGQVGDWGSRRGFFRANADGTRNVLEALNGWRGHFVHLSSIAVHGFRRGSYDENSPVRASRNPYAASKVAAEKLVEKAVGSGLNASIVRIAGVYGPGDPHFIARLLALARTGRVYFIGRGDQPTNLIFIDDVIEGLRRIIDWKGGPGARFILSHPDAPGVRDALRQAISILGLKTQIRRIPMGIAYPVAFAQEVLGRLTHKSPLITRYVVKAMARSCFFSIEVTGRKLGWRPRTAFSEGVVKTMSWYAQNS